MASPKNAPKQIVEPPLHWQQVHEISRKRMLKAEAQSLTKMRGAVRDLHKQLMTDLGDSKITALRQLKSARTKMAQIVSDHISQTRSRARDAALDQASFELKVLARETGKKGLAHKLGSAGEVTPTATATDMAAADAVGHSFASRWAQSVMHHVVDAPVDQEMNISLRARLAVQQMDHQLQRIAATENAKAYNDQHEDAIEDALLDDTETDVAVEEVTATAGSEEEAAAEVVEAVQSAGVYKYWDAYLDRGTCGDCSRHNGETVPVGMPFSGGDEPGDMHPNCRCIETIVYM